MVGVELVADRETRTPFPRGDRLTERIVRAAREAGLLLYSGTGLADGTNGDAILLGPPFVVTDDELVRIADGLAGAIETATAAAVV
jgi:adenosylmethionine-8-amino-7-oxononanoate aminotransferase